MMYEKENFLVTPTKKMSRSHQNILYQPVTIMTEEKIIFRKQLEDFTSYNLEAHPSKQIFINSEYLFNFNILLKLNFF